MLIRVTPAQAPLVLGAMRRVASAGGTEPLGEADRNGLVAFDRFILRREAPDRLADLRERYGIPPLDPRYAAGRDVPAWYHPVA